MGWRYLNYFEIINIFYHHVLILIANCPTIFFNSVLDIFFPSYHCFVEFLLFNISRRYLVILFL